MKVFSLLFLVLISFASSVWLLDYEKCMKNGKEGVCCRLNSNGCCDYKPGQMCLQVITQCCAEKKLDPTTNQMTIKYFSKPSGISNFEYY